MYTYTDIVDKTVISKIFQDPPQAFIFKRLVKDEWLHKNKRRLMDKYKGRALVMKSTQSYGKFQLCNIASLLS